MKKIEAPTLEQAYAQAAAEFGCSVTALQVEIVQFPSKGVLGLFKKSAIIVANLPHSAGVSTAVEVVKESVVVEEPAVEEEIETASVYVEPEELVLGDEFYEQADDFEEEGEMEGDFYQLSAQECADEVKEQINILFKDICFDINAVDVSVYDENTLLVEFTGADAALMIGKEGYRYKALSYMLFNWINAVYGMQLRLEIAEFLKNQEESISRYLINVCDVIDQDGRAQTKVLDGVLVQIALKQLRDRYPDRYVAIRSTRDGGKFIIINSYHEY
ncbi:MAG: Jag N-terminal domain-containing protein [Sulfuricurvum sp.]|jgi:spoIIIJ-associated protein|uniref:Jag N-terminal domain-containing protein n=1 Tax=Sulfuricurvum sp. TaxID=2025608 RepID=UPI00272205A1|nr:Jag N-terminal domain-containing protein [Sulfuricurvum sp.]MDO9056221.1 Jag N-terminal domain-containing protein [Sulfuricurvum sp.]MDP2849542.1 Jag N-terminal domain-containing protein [Sulfuricurvum sp.]MDP3291931.1 Jag N-terminal domain-containing protein [Sulfuricurvum sp.]